MMRVIKICFDKGKGKDKKREFERCAERRCPAGGDGGGLAMGGDIEGQ